MNHALFATIVGSFAILFWGITIPLSKFVSSSLGQFTTVGICLLFGGVLFRLIFGAPKPIPSTKLLLLRFALYSLYFISLHAAVAATSKEALPVILLANYLWPIATVIWSKIFKRLAISRRLLFSIFMVVVALVLEKGGASFLDTPKPDLIWFLVAIFAALLWGAYSALNQFLATQWGDVSHLCLLAFPTGVILLFIGCLRGEPQNFELAPIAPYATYIICTILGQYLWDYGTRNGKIIVLGFIADLTPWISLFTAGILFHTPIPLTVYLAAALVLSAAWIARRE
jgi:drug/metabolite transporter (DMT)-like permease